MMSTEEGLTIDNAVVILQVIRNGEHKLLATPLLLTANTANFFELVGYVCLLLQVICEIFAKYRG